MDLQSGHVLDTQQSMNQPWGCAVYGQESQVEGNMEWQHTEGDADKEEYANFSCEDEEGESDNYDDFYHLIANNCLPFDFCRC